MTSKKTPKKPKGKVVYLPNRLREKVGGGPLSQGAIDDELIAKAESKVQELSVSFGEQALTDMTQLVTIFENLKNAPVSEQHSFIRQINSIMHEVRGNGASFNFPLLSEFASSLFRFTEHLTSASAPQLEIIKAHVDALFVVVNQKIMGDGGDVGLQLKQSLRIAIQKYS